MRFLKPMSIAYCGQRWTLFASLRLNVCYIGFSFHRGRRRRGLAISLLPFTHIGIEWESHV